jgi:hypothetical protein
MVRATRRRKVSGKGDHASANRRHSDLQSDEHYRGYATSMWWKDARFAGSYVSGSWARISNSAIARLFFASAVLADGRVLFAVVSTATPSGSQTADETSNAKSTTRSPIPEPVRPHRIWWRQPSSSHDPANIGDAPCTVLPDGTFLLGQIPVATQSPEGLTMRSSIQRQPPKSLTDFDMTLSPPPRTFPRAAV